MAFTALTAADLAVGKPTKKELWDLIKSNFDDHETRILATEAATAEIDPIVYYVIGKYTQLATPKTGLMYYRAPYALTLTGAVLMIYEDGGSGTLEVDVQKKSGVGAFATVFSTKPSVASGSGDFTTSSNAVLSVTSVAQNDILRLDLTSKMASGDPDGFELRLSFS